MAVEKLNPDFLHTPVDNLYAHIVRATGRVHYRFSGQVAVGRTYENVFVGDMEGQLRFCYEQVTLALQAVSLTWQDVTHVYTFTTDMDEYMKFEKDIVKHFFGETPPASTLVQVSQLVDPAWLVEVQVDAVTDN